MMMKKMPIKTTQDRGWVGAVQDIRPKQHILNFNLVQTSLFITYYLITQSFWNFAPCRAASRLYNRNICYERTRFR